MRPINVSNTGITVSANKKSGRMQVCAPEEDMSKAKEFVVAALHVIAPGDHSRQALSAIIPRGSFRRYLRWSLRANLNLKWSTVSLW